MPIDHDWLRQWYSRIVVGQQIYPMIRAGCRDTLFPNLGAKSQFC
jgi:hypothetical protein